MSNQGLPYPFAQLFDRTYVRSNVCSSRRPQRPAARPARLIKIFSAHKKIFYQHKKFFSGQEKIKNYTLL